MAKKKTTALARRGSQRLTTSGCAKRLSCRRWGKRSKKACTTLPVHPCAVKLGHLGGVGRGLSPRYGSPFAGSPVKLNPVGDYLSDFVTVANPVLDTVKPAIWAFQPATLKAYVPQVLVGAGALMVNRTVWRPLLAKGLSMTGLDKYTGDINTGWKAVVADLLGVGVVAGITNKVKPQYTSAAMVGGLMNVTINLLEPWFNKATSYLRYSAPVVPVTPAQTVAEARVAALMP